MSRPYNRDTPHASTKTTERHKVQGQASANQGQRCPRLAGQANRNQHRMVLALKAMSVKADCLARAS